MLVLKYYDREWETGASTKEITHRRLRWLGHVLRVGQERVTLRWTPPGKRNPGRPKTTWHRTVTQELEQMNLMGRGPTCCQGANAMESARWSLMSHRGHRGGMWRLWYYASDVSLCLCCLLTNLSILGIVWCIKTLPYIHISYVMCQYVFQPETC